LGGGYQEPGTSILKLFAYVASVSSSSVALMYVTLQPCGEEVD
jgi:hypothetical protein